MPEVLQFDPVQSAHAVERCTVIILFAEALPERIFSTLRRQTFDELAAAGFRPAAFIGFRVELGQGKIVPISEDTNQPVNFSSADQSLQLMIAPNSITLSTSRYVRWKPFFGELQRAIGKTLESFLNAVSPKSVRLDYVDRFFWNGTWNDFDDKKLIQTDSGLVSSVAAQAHREWHSHCGWFEAVEDYRRLIGANIDVQAALPAGGIALKPSVAITTTIQDEFNVPEYGSTVTDELNKDFLFNRLEILHADIKGLLGRIIVPEMAKRIGLKE